MLKVGDKLLCKKSYHHGSVYNKVEGKYYIITMFDSNMIFFDDDYYSIDPNYKWYIWDWFYTQQEIRKMKLKKLKQCLK